MAARELRPVSYRAENGALVVAMEVKARCPGGDIVSSDRLKVTIRDADGLICSAAFDFSQDPLIVGGDTSQPTVVELTFEGGSYVRHPNSLGDRSAGRGSDGVVTDASASGTEVVDCVDEGTSAGPQNTVDHGALTPRRAATSTDAGAPNCGGEADALAALRAQLIADEPFVRARLADRWVAQLSSKQPGLVAPDVDGRMVTWTPCEILQQHLRLRGQYPEVRLVWSDDWRTFDLAGWWVTIAGVTFPTLPPPTGGAMHAGSRSTSATPKSSAIPATPGDRRDTAAELLRGQMDRRRRRGTTATNSVAFSRKHFAIANCSGAGHCPRVSCGPERCGPVGHRHGHPS